MKAYLVLVTVPSRKEASRLSNTLLRENRIACSTAISGVASTYWWKGKLTSGKETLLMLKTTSRHYKALEKRIRDLHSYEVPEILAIPIAAANPEYLTWVKKSVR